MTWQLSHSLEFEIMKQLFPWRWAKRGGGGGGIVP